MIIILLACLLFLWLYSAIRLHKKDIFCNFLLACNRRQRQELRAAMLQLNDCNQYLESMVDEVDQGEDGCSDVVEIRKRIRIALIMANKKEIFHINNLNE